MSDFDTDSKSAIRENKNNKEQEKSTGKEMLGFLLYVVILVLACFLMIKFVAVRSVVDGNSMYPTLENGDNLLVEKVSYYFHDPERFDIVVFEVRNAEDTHYVKRVIGLPGETVQVKEGKVYINGELLESDVYGYEPMLDGYEAAVPITLGEDEFFVLGDNRNHSMDSRTAYVGNIKKEEIVGRACLRFWPLGKFGSVVP